jgi:hypothetical protein
MQSILKTNLNLIKPSDHVGAHCEFYRILVRYERLLFSSNKNLIKEI